MSFKFSKINRNPEIAKIQKEIQDNFGTQSEIEQKMSVVKDIKKSPPKVTTLKDGEKKYYDDGTNQWRYERIGGRLFKTQLTEV